jgi:hypothetical protein
MPGKIRQEILGDLELYEALMTFESDTLSIASDASPDRAQDAARTRIRPIDHTPGRRSRTGPALARSDPRQATVRFKPDTTEKAAREAGNFLAGDAECSCPEHDANRP